jgi:hypothetical protein
MWILHCERLIQEGEGSGASILRVLGKKIEVNTSGQIVREGDVGGKVGRWVQCARALAAVKSLVKGVLVDPVSASEGGLEALDGAVASTFDAVIEEEVDFSDNTSHIDASIVANAATLDIIGNLEVEFVLGNLVLAYGAIPFVC